MHINETTHGGMVDKAARYGWTIKDQPGRLMMLDKAVLEVDNSYQRDTAAAKIKRIAAQWSWLACGALIVADRGDGRFFVIDGQHRAEAAMKLSAVQKLPCIVFETGGSREEAGGFLRANRDRKPMTSVQAFSAMVTAGDPDAMAVQELLESHGLVARDSGSGNSQAFKSVGVLLQIVRRGKEHASRVLAASVAACHGGKVHSDVLKGMSWIDMKADDPAILPKIGQRLQAIGRDGVLAEIAKAKNFHGSGGEKPCAEGILKAYNFRLKHKLELQ